MSKCKECHQEIKDTPVLDAASRRLTFGSVFIYLEAVKAVCSRGVNIELDGVYHTPKVMVICSFTCGQSHWYMACREVGTNYAHDFNGDNEVPDPRFFKIADNLSDYLGDIFGRDTGTDAG